LPKDALTVTRDGDVATVRIDRPPVNAVDPAMIDEFLDVLPQLAADEAVRCIVLRGTGRTFVAGADIAVMRDLSDATQTAMRRWVDVQRMLELAPKPVIAAINGYALGGGAELALACDLRIAARSAVVGFPELQLGLFPGAGGSQRLMRLVGHHRAKLMMMRASRFSGQDAVDAGLVDTVVDDADLDAAVHMAAHELAAQATRTIVLLKRSLDEGAAVPLDEALMIEWAAVLEVNRTADAAEGLQAFLDKRTPRFEGR
jgi:enoyl-CoA hydratase